MKVPCCALGRLDVWNPWSAYAAAALLAAGTAVVVLGIHEHVRGRQHRRRAANVGETWHSVSSDFATAAILAAAGSVAVRLILHVLLGASGLILTRKIVSPRLML